MQQKILIHWDSSYSIGVKVIDEQHKKLIDIINKLYSGFLNAEANKILGDILQEVYDYTKFHFDFEENLLTKNQYPKLKEHIEEHEKFVGKTKEFLEIQRKGSKVLTYEVMNFLRKWLLEHIAEEDKKYVSYLK